MFTFLVPVHDAVVTAAYSGVIAVLPPGIRVVLTKFDGAFDNIELDWRTRTDVWTVRKWPDENYQRLWTNQSSVRLTLTDIVYK